MKTSLTEGMSHHGVCNMFYEVNKNMFVENFKTFAGNAIIIFRTVLSDTCRVCVPQGKTPTTSLKQVQRSLFPQINFSFLDVGYLTRKTDCFSEIWRCIPMCTCTICFISQLESGFSGLFHDIFVAVIYCCPDYINIRSAYFCYKTLLNHG